MRIAPLTCHIGAELSGVSLAEAARNDDLFTEIKSALLAHKVLFLRDQDIARGDHVAFASRFGALEDHPVLGSDPDHPGLVRIYKDESSPPDFYENSWHCDATWRDVPPMGAVLHCLACPPVGGDTMWANMAKAYADLPDHVKQTIAPLKARHSIEASFGARMSEEQRHALKAQYPDAEHPVVRTHPETGERALYVNTAFTTHIEGLSAKESAWLLDHLYAQASRPEYQCRFRWQTNSIAFWDNRACQHYAVADYYPALRAMERVTVVGDKPYFDPGR